MAGRYDFEAWEGSVHGANNSAASETAEDIAANERLARGIAMLRERATQIDARDLNAVDVTQELRNMKRGTEFEVANILRMSRLPDYLHPDDEEVVVFGNSDSDASFYVWFEWLEPGLLFVCFSPRI